MDLAVILITFGAIFLVELPDKTFIAALVLSTRYRPLLVWIGVGLAFFVQTLVAVAAGKLATFLPDTLIQGVSAVIFVLGAIVLIRTAPRADAEERGAGAGVRRQGDRPQDRAQGGRGIIPGPLRRRVG